MVKCRWCNLEMGDAKTVTCTHNPTVEFPDGTRLPAVPYEADGGYRCHDCNIADGGYHHPGCDMERCPNCGGQLISCGCLDEDHPGIMFAIHYYCEPEGSSSKVEPTKHSLEFRMADLTSDQAKIWQAYLSTFLSSPIETMLPGEFAHSLSLDAALNQLMKPKPQPPPKLKRDAISATLVLYDNSARIQTEVGLYPQEKEGVCIDIRDSLGEITATLLLGGSDANELMLNIADILVKDIIAK